MPIIGPRPGQFDAAKALAEGISGYTRGTQDARRQNQRDREEQRKLEAYQAAADQRDREEQRVNASREFLIQEAEESRVKRQRAAAEQFRSGMSAEEYSAKRANIQAGFDRIKAMAPNLTPLQLMELSREYAEGEKQKLIAGEYEGIHQRMAALERNDYGMALEPAQSKEIRKLMEGGASPNDVNRMLDTFENHNAQAVKTQNRRSRGLVLGNELLARLRAKKGNDDNLDGGVDVAEDVLSHWMSSGYQTRSTKQLEDDMLQAATGEVSRGTQIQKYMDSRYPQRGGQKPVSDQDFNRKRAQAEIGSGPTYNDMTFEERLEQVRRSHAGAGRSPERATPSRSSVK